MPLRRTAAANASVYESTFKTKYYTKRDEHYTTLAWPAARQYLCSAIEVQPYCQALVPGGFI